MWTFAIVNRDEIWSEEHLRRWKRLISSAVNPHVFFHPAMVKTWLDTFSPIRNLKPIFVWSMDDAGHQAFLPLVLWRRNWKNAFLKMVVPVGSSDYDYRDPLSDTPIDKLYYSELKDFLLTNYSLDEICLDGIRIDDMSIADDAHWTKGEMCPRLVLEGISSQDDLFGFLKTSLRGDIRRQMRRLAEIGPLTLVEYKTNQDAMKTFGEFMDYHRKRWPKAYRAPHLHENMIKDEMLGSVVHFSSLNVGDKPVAWHLGFEFDGRYYYYMPAGNPEFMSMSPVKVHLFMLISRAAERGLNVFDHLRGAENYKQGWSNELENIYCMRHTGGGILTQCKKLLLSLR